jgi:hypothetical protein
VTRGPKGEKPPGRRNRRDCYGIASDLAEMIDEALLKRGKREPYKKASRLKERLACEDSQRHLFGSQYGSR